MTGATVEWGRVADDGTVYVRTAEGERAVGTWTGGSAAEGLGRYSLRYEAVWLQVEAQHRNVAEGDIAAAQRDLPEIRKRISKGSMIGDMAALEAEVVRLEESIVGFRDSAVNRRVALVEEAEALLTLDDARTATQRYRTLMDEWRALPQVDRKTEDALWKRLAGVRDGIRGRAGEIQAQVAVARDVKEHLIAEAERLATSTEWGATSRRLRELMADWKAAGRVGRGADDELWARFRAAQDRFFARRAEVDAERVANGEAKEALVVEAEALLPVTVASEPTVTAALRSIHDRWNEIGHVPRERQEGLERRLRAVDQAVSDVAGVRQKSESQQHSRAGWQALFEQALESLEDRVQKASTPEERAKLEAELAAKRALISG